MQDRSSTMARQNQQSAYAKAPGGGNMKKSTPSYTSPTSQTKTTNNGNAGNGSWGPHFKNRDHFVSMHFS